MAVLTLADIRADPGRCSTQVTTPNGLPLTIRPLQAHDRAPLGAYFLSLSEQTKAWYGPHPFDQPTADRLCAELDDPQQVLAVQALRLIACLPQDGAERLIAYFILYLGVFSSEIERYAQLAVPLNPQTDCMVAPSVTDDWQNQGLGSLVMRHTLAIAQRLGRRRAALMGGVFVANQRAVHFYQKMGFHSVGTFADPDHPERPSYDMFLELNDQGKEI